MQRGSRPGSLTLLRFHSLTSLVCRYDISNHRVVASAATLVQNHAKWTISPARHGRNSIPSSLPTRDCPACQKGRQRPSHLRLTRLWRYRRSLGKPLRPARRGCRSCRGNCARYRRPRFTAAPAPLGCWSRCCYGRPLAPRKPRRRSRSRLQRRQPAGRGQRFLRTRSQANRHRL